MREVLAKSKKSPEHWMDELKETLELDEQMKDDDYVFVKDMEEGEEDNNVYDNEKISRKALLKMGMKPLTDVIRVTIERSNNIVHVISKPDIFKGPNSENYVILGEASSEDEDHEDVDESGLIAKDIDLVMAQTGASRSKAVKALKANVRDIVSAIMALITI